MARKIEKKYRTNIVFVLFLCLSFGSISCDQGVAPTIICTPGERCFDEVLFISRLTSVPSQEAYSSNWQNEAQAHFYGVFDRELEVNAAGSLKEAAKAIALKIFESPESVTISQLSAGFDQGQSSAIIFVASSGEEKKIIKVFPLDAASTLASEVAGWQSLVSLGLKTIEVARIEAFAKVATPENKYYVKVEEFSEGAPLGKYLNSKCVEYVNANASGKKEVKNVINGVLQNVSSSMAELANSRLSLGAGLHPYWRGVFLGPLDKLELLTLNFPQYVRSVTKFKEWYEAKLEQVEHIPRKYFAVGHLDFHPGNIIISKGGQKIYYIDLPDVALSRTLLGQPIALAALDFEKMNQLLGQLDKCNPLNGFLPESLKKHFESEMPPDFFSRKISSLLNAYFRMDHAYWHPEGENKLLELILSENWN